eukprot:TRINITY_DN6443_c0_g1_i2.p1 TRINITY_DN6443_c0_g1~~TRINITY_DN6443_c0_g1_i2.p1  ORF type:complete len:947 (-),score=250.26 TRINITY_DN6443_c0_g1_i2:295-3135(-)
MSVQDVVDAYIREEVAVKIWLEQMFECELQKDYVPLLRDGTRLCKLMLALRPGSIPIIAEDTSAFFHIKNNIRFFLDACEEEYEIKRSRLFDVYDLYQLKNVPKVVLCLKALALAAHQANADVPPLNVDLSAEVMREHQNIDADRLKSVAVLLIQANSRRSHVMKPRRPSGRPLPQTPPAGAGGTKTSEQAGPKRKSGLMWMTRGTAASESMSVDEAGNTLVTKRRGQDSGDGIGMFGEEMDMFEKECQELEGAANEKRDAVSGTPNVPLPADGSDSLTGEVEEAEDELEALLQEMLREEAALEAAINAEEGGAAGREYLYPIDSETGFTVLDSHPDVLERVTDAVTRVQAAVRGRKARRIFRKRVRNEAYRAKVAREILATETDYNQNLRLLLHAFVVPLCELNTGEKWEQQLSSIRSQIQIILAYGMQLLKEMKPRVAEWNHRQRLGDVFLRITDYMKVYTQYVRDFSPLMDTIVAEKKSKGSSLRSKLAELEEQDEVKSRGLPFESYLILPVQRIPRYEMLLNDMLNHTSESHPDFENLHKAKHKMTDVGAYVNARQRDFEALAKVVEVDHKFGELEGLVKSHRKLLREGDLSKYPRGGRKFRCFLFNDLILIGTPMDKKDKKYRLKSQFRLLKLVLSDIAADDPDVHGFSMRNRESSEEGFEAMVESEEEKRSWMQDIKEATQALRTSSSQLAMEESEEEEIGVKRGAKRSFLSIRLTSDDPSAGSPSGSRRKNNILHSLRGGSGDGEGEDRDRLSPATRSHKVRSAEVEGDEHAGRVPSDNDTSSVPSSPNISDQSKRTRHKRTKSFDAFFNRTVSQSPEVEPCGDGGGAEAKKKEEKKKEEKKKEAKKVEKKKDDKKGRRLTLTGFMGSGKDKKPKTGKRYALDENVAKKLAMCAEEGRAGLRSGGDRGLDGEEMRSRTGVRPSSAIIFAASDSDDENDE